MRHAYLILAHKDEIQLLKLVNFLLCDRNNIIIINIDSKYCPQNFLFENEERIKVFRNLSAINWGGFSMVEATIYMMKYLQKNFKSKISFVSLLSGQDFPLASSQAINNYLINNNYNYIEFFPLPREKEWNMNGGLDRYEYIWSIDEKGFKNSFEFVSIQKRHNIIKKIPKCVTQLFGGSQWWTLNFDCILYILKFIETNPEYIDFYKSSFIPDESFFQTIICNSHFFQSCVNNNLRYIDWSIAGKSPKILTENDLEKILKSNMLFARKFETPVSEKVLSEILKMKIDYD